MSENNVLSGTTARKVLDVGCGRRKIPGAVGVDVLAVPGVDVVWDLNRFPWPFEDNSFAEVNCSHVLEHLDDVVKVMEEIHRIGAPGARIAIEVPHFSHPGAFCDPTHKHYFSYYSFDYFTGNPVYPVYTDVRFAIKERGFKAVSGMNRFLSRRIEPHLYEERFARVFPSYALTLILEVIK